MKKTKKSDKLAKPNKSSETTDQGSVACHSNFAQTVLGPCQQEFAKVQAKFEGKSETEMWQKAEKAAQQLSDMMWALRVHYQWRRERGEGDRGVLQLFWNAAETACEGFFTLSAFAGFFADAERRQPKDAAELRQWFEKSLWCRDRPEYERLMSEVFDAAEV